MKRMLMGFLVLALAATTVRAHFVWILPPAPGAKPVVQLVFSDKLAPDDPMFLTKIKQTEVFVLQEKNKPAQLKANLGKEALEAEFDAKGIQVIGAHCEYGVTSRGGMDFLLNYYAKTVIAPEGKNKPADVVPVLEKLNAEALALDIVPMQEGIKVLWQGKPLADAEVILIGDGDGTPVERKTDKNGLVALNAEDVKTAGVKELLGVRAKYVEPKEGTVGDKKYKEVRHYSTLTIRVGKK